MGFRDALPRLGTQFPFPSWLRFLVDYRRRRRRFRRPRASRTTLAQHRLYLTDLFLDALPLYLQPFEGSREQGLVS
ncbi:MAG TPA: hypothetical protein DEH78_07235 [Solibacterales bacterium]|nr:hypothetical protein [Bryobacterales bacterium]